MSALHVLVLIHQRTSFTLEESSTFGTRYVINVKWALFPLYPGHTVVTFLKVFLDLILYAKCHTHVITLSSLSNKVTRFSNQATH